MPSNLLEPDVLHQLATLEGYRRHPAGDVICREGEPGDEMYVILEGDVSVTVENRLLDRHGPGTVFGEMALVDNEPRSATVTAVTDSRLLPVDRRRFASLIKQSPELAIQVMSIMSFRLRRLIVEEVKHQRLEEELRIGREIQANLLPKSTPKVPGWEFAAFYRPAKQVGGDLYDFLPAPGAGHGLNIVIADVTGKGVPAALFMAVSQATFRAESQRGYSPAEILRRANNLILFGAGSRLLLSVCYGALETDTGRLTLANGGLNQPLWRRASSGVVEPAPATGFLLGAFPDIVFEECAIDLAPGDIIVFYTDGVTEARNSDEAFFGDEALEKLVSLPWNSAQELLDAIVDAVNAFIGDVPPSDDLTIVVMKRVVSRRLAESD